MSHLETSAEGARRRGRPPSTPGSGTHRKAHERIETTDAANLFNALKFAARLNREPNTFVTVQWRHAESTRPVPDRLRRLINLAGTWTRRRTGQPAVWAYVREPSLGKSEHLHLLIHVPQNLRSQFDKALRNWIAEEATGEVRPSAVRISNIADGTLHGELTGYLLKDGSDDVRRAFWVKAHHHRTEGVIMGKRVKVSHSIGRAARRKALE